jgi:BlaI family transcriptional regulator, penicillinase repressor
MAKTALPTLTRRERQIMDILYRRGRATAAEVNEDLPGEPHYSTVRTQLRVLEEKGRVRRAEEGLRYVYMPAVPRRAARKSALKHLVDTFFDGSAESAVAALLGGEGARLSEAELDRIADLIAKAKKEKP